MMVLDRMNRLVVHTKCFKDMTKPDQTRPKTKTKESLVWFGLTGSGLIDLFLQ